MRRLATDAERSLSFIAFFFSRREVKPARNSARLALDIARHDAMRCEICSSSAFYSSLFLLATRKANFSLFSQLSLSKRRVYIRTPFRDAASSFPHCVFDAKRNDEHDFPRLLPFLSHRPSSLAVESHISAHLIAYK